MLKRNSTCYCGSGKKYKKCCLKKDEDTKLTIYRNEKIKNAYVNTFLNINSYANSRDDFEAISSEAAKIFFPKLGTYSKTVNSLFNSFLFKDYVSLESKSTLLIDYYKQLTNSDKYSDAEATVLHAMSTAYISVYTIETLTDTFVVFKDIFSEKTFKVYDKQARSGLSLDKHYIASITNIFGSNISTEILFEIPDDNILTNLIEDINYLHKLQKDSHESFESFLRANSLLFYYHIIQIVEPKTVEYFEEMVKNSTTNPDIDNSTEEKATSLENNILISKDTLDKIDAEYKNQVLDIISKSVASGVKINKVSESGWVSAAEYFVKKENNQSVTQNQIAEKYNISASTLGKRYKAVKDLSL